MQKRLISRSPHAGAPIDRSEPDADRNAPKGPAEIGPPVVGPAITGIIADRAVIAVDRAVVSIGVPVAHNRRGPVIGGPDVTDGTGGADDADGPPWAPVAIDDPAIVLAPLDRPGAGLGISCLDPVEIQRLRLRGRLRETSPRDRNRQGGKEWTEMHDNLLLIAYERRGQRPRSDNHAELRRPIQKARAQARRGGMASRPCGAGSLPSFASSSWRNH